MVVWSECTFWVRSRTLSIFALIVKNASDKHNYFNLEIFCIFIIGYLCFCAYSTLFQIKVRFWVLFWVLRFQLKISAVQHLFHCAQPPNGQLFVAFYWNVSVPFDAATVSQFSRLNSHGHALYRVQWQHPGRRAVHYAYGPLGPE